MWLLLVAVVLGVVFLAPIPLGGVHEPASKLDNALVLPLCALVDQGHYQDAEAMTLELLPEVEAEWGKNSLETAEILDVLTEALWRGGKATDAATLEYANRALEIRQSQLGHDHPIVADSLVEKANVLKKRAEIDDAEKLLKRAIAVYGRVYGKGDSHVAMALNNLGTLYHDTDRYDSSRESLQKAIELYEGLCGPDCFDLTGTLGNLASTLAALGEYEEAEELLRRELAIYEQTVGLRDPRAIATIHNLGLNLHQQGRYMESRVLMKRAITAKEETLGPAHPSLAMSVGNLASLESDLGHVEEAEHNYQLCISIFEQALGEDHPDTAQALVNFGAFLEVRDYVAARNQYEKALEVFRATYGDNHSLVAWTQTSLGRALTGIGDWERAESYLEQAIDYWDRHLSPNMALQIAAIREMGRLELDKGHLATARDYFDRAWSLELESHGQDHLHVSGVQALIGEVLLRQEAYGEAEILFLQVLDAVERNLGSAHGDFASALVMMGDLRFATGEWTEALGYYRQALSILEIVYAGPTLETAQLRLKIARCLTELGSRRPAAVAALQAEDVSRAHLRLMLTGMPESEGLRFARSRSTGLDLAFSLIVSGAEGDLVAATVDSLIRSRALVLDEMANRWRGVNLQQDPAIESLVDELAAARRRLAYLVVRGPDEPENLATYTSLLQGARADRERTERDLAIKSRSFRLQNDRKLAGLKEVVAALPRNSGLVGFARIQLLDLEEDIEKERLAAEGEPSYIAFVLIDQNSDPEVVLLGYADEIDDLVQRTQGHILEETESLGVGEEWSEAVYRRDAELLKRRIWDPIVDRLGDLDLVFIVPDGALHMINFAALPDGDSNYLIDRGLQIHYLSAERDLVSREPGLVGEGLLALGNPDFEGEGLPVTASAESSTSKSSAITTRGQGRYACENLQSMKFRALPGADAELSRVVSLWSGRLGAQRDVTDLRGSRASEAAFKSEAHGKRVLHLATHGFFVGEHCPPNLALNPLLRSGLALAGANRRQGALPGEEDGILTAEEIAALDLEGVEWAVLSACESGLGEIRNGEGVLGLRRAFSVAGAQTLIMSLWQVDDEPTRDWMSLLYEHRYSEGLETAEAVHHASLELLELRRQQGLTTHPFYWAGFVAAGDWR